MSNAKDQTTCCLIIVVLGLGKQLGASVCHDRLALWKENISSWRYVVGEPWVGGVVGVERDWRCYLEYLIEL